MMYLLGGAHMTGPIHDYIPFDSIFINIELINMRNLSVVFAFAALIDAALFLLFDSIPVHLEVN